MVRTVFVFRVFLDPMHHNDFHISGDLQGGQPTGEADPLPARQPGTSAAQWRGAQLQVSQKFKVMLAPNTLLILLHINIYLFSTYTSLQKKVYKYHITSSSHG